MGKPDKLANFLREASNWSWDEFARAEKDKQYTTNESIIFALIRACASQQLSAIKMALNRIDGKLKTPIRVEYPKFFYLYPHAETPLRVEKPQTFAKVTDDPNTVNEVESIIEGEVLPAKKAVEAAEEEVRDLPSMGLRETLVEMSDYPRELPEAIIDLALQTEQWLNKRGDRPQEIPKVKSVVAAHLLVMAQRRNIDALTEVFDQIDGKLVETLQIIGEDVYLEVYSTDVPDNATLNSDGVWQVEAPVAQAVWAEKLAQDMKDHR